MRGLFVQLPREWYDGFVFAMVYLPIDCMVVGVNNGKVSFRMGAGIQTKILLTNLLCLKIITEDN